MMSLSSFNPVESEYATRHVLGIWRVPQKYIEVPFAPVRSKAQAKSDALRKHDYTQKISPPKTESFQIKNSNIFNISARNIDCGHSLEPSWRCGSHAYPQSMFYSRNKKN